MRHRLNLRQTLGILAVAALFTALFYHTDPIGRVAYALERGKLRADLEHLSRIDAEITAGLDKISHAFNVISEAVKPSVVHIQAMATNSALNDELQKMFGSEDFTPIPSTGTGSGVILDEDGYIVTNNHVVEDAQAITVALVDGRRYRAEIIGTDPKTDLAVIKINADRLHPIQFGDSDDMKVGNLVLAIGSPFRLGHSVSHGIISASGRSDVGVDIEYQNFLQTDAPINPGNSGGPLLNTQGQVIGISVAIATESGGNQGVGFAIPSNTVRRVAQTLREGRTIVRGYLGVEIKPVTTATVDAYELPQQTGVFVNGVGEDTPAAKGGLRPEDIVLRINGRTITSREQLQDTVAATNPGTEVEMAVWRAGKEKTIRIKIGEQPGDFSTRGSIRRFNPTPTPRSVPNRNRELPKSQDDAAGPDGSNDKQESAREKTPLEEKLGFYAESLTPALRKQHKLHASTPDGIIISNVDPTSEAFASDLRNGQIIIEANGKPVATSDDLEAALTPKALRKGVRLKLSWNNDVFYTVLQIR